uniref:Uncharacterized protein n=2 Tax=Oryza sativa subsp. japonica TaxID=39947 RepID=Q53NZ6_ORYSJ|nr:hypothetical protein LOC_Os11g11610 [Oryza sativa Japonica Group]ABA92151.1 hypothetical protein LOC_Os11g11610 [Oryza sativa Japonica Group]
MGPTCHPHPSPPLLPPLFPISPLFIPLSSPLSPGDGEAAAHTAAPGRRWPTCAAAPEAGGGGGRDANCDTLVPSFVRTDGCGRGDHSPPVHTFGFGKDHDAVAMHTIAEVTGGTFSFIENEAAIQDGFAQCIAPLRRRDMERTGQTTSVAGDEEAESGVAERSVEVDRELVRVEAIDDIALE